MAGSPRDYSTVQVQYVHDFRADFHIVMQAETQLAGSIYSGCKRVVALFQLSLNGKLTIEGLQVLPCAIVGAHALTGQRVFRLS